MAGPAKVILGGIKMRRSYFMASVLAVIVFLFGGIAVFGQTGELRGSVKMAGADGTPVPVPNAVIDIYRTDITGEYHTKTDKKGQWVFAGLPYVGRYVLAVSAAGAAPTAQGGVMAGHEIIYDLVLSAGSGKKLTRDEAVAAASGGGSTSAAASTGESAADKAKREELAKKNAEIEASNKKIESANKIISDAFTNGNTALMAKNYDEAIKQYDLGIAADPEHPGIASLLTNKSAALRSRAVDKYNAAIQSKDEAARAAGIS